jgi:hypothetical protein
MFVTCHDISLAALSLRVIDHRQRCPGSVIREADDRNLTKIRLDLPCSCGERLAHFAGLSVEGDGALEAER